MRRFYFLFIILTGLFLKARAQDSVSFSFSIATGNNVVFTNTSHLHGNDLHKAFWTFGDGSSRVQTGPLAGIQHQYANNGSFTACLRIYRYSSINNDSTLAGEFCRTVTLQTNTQADSCRANFTDTVPASAAGIKTFVAQPWHNHDKKPEQVCWNFGDGHDTCISYNPSLANNYAVAHAYAQPGQYYVCVKIRYQGGCISTYCRLVNTGDPCRIDFTSEPVPALPLSKHFVAQPWHYLQKKPLRICWFFGDGKDTCVFYTTAMSGPFTVNHTYAHGGQYTVCVKILFDGGCESQKCKTISVETPPAPTPDTCFVNVFEVATSLNNTERHFYAGTAPGKVPEKICWNFGDGTDSCIVLPNPSTPVSLSIVHHFPGPGVYHVCAKLWYVGGCVVQKCIEVHINAGNHTCGGYMTDSLTAARTFLFKGFSILNANDHVVSWRWTFGDGAIASTPQATHTYAAGGNYEVCLYIKSDLGCETKICRQVVVQSANNQPQLVLSPNPVTTNVHAVFQSVISEQVTISIYNANGILVRNYSRAATQGTNAWDFDVATLPVGIYTVIVHSPNQLANAVFIKQ